MGPFISIGTGLTPMDSFGKRSNNLSNAFANLKAAVKVASRTLRTHERMIREADWDGEERFPYFRFDGGPQLGEVRLSEWESYRFTGVTGKDGTSGHKTLKKIEAAIAVYLCNRDVQRDLTECAKLLVNRRRLRARNASDWDRYASYSHYVCNMKSCPERSANTADDFKNHLQRNHNFKLVDPVMDTMVAECRHVQWLYRPHETTQESTARKKGEGRGGTKDIESSIRDSIDTADSSDLESTFESSIRDSIDTADSSALESTFESSIRDSMETADSSYLESAVIEDQMSQVSQEVVTGLQSSGESTRRMTTFIHWNFKDYFKDELRDGQELARVLTLSGNAERAYAASYAQYVQWLWPETGLWLLEMIERVVHEGRYRELHLEKTSIVGFAANISRRKHSFKRHCDPRVPGTTRRWTADSHCEWTTRSFDEYCTTASMAYSCHEGRSPRDTHLFQHTFPARWIYHICHCLRRCTPSERRQHAMLASTVCGFVVSFWFSSTGARRGERPRASIRGDAPVGLGNIRCYVR